MVGLSAGALNRYVTLDEPGDPVFDTDGAGGYTKAYTPLNPPNWWVSIQPATARRMESLVAGGAVTSNATHIVTGRYHSGITTKTRITYGTRVFQVTGVVNVDEANLATVAICTESVN